METPLCPQCRTPLPAQALGGLCPACMFEQGAFDSQSNIAGSAFIPPSVGELAPLFPSLEVLELVGRGGMGAVYKARQTELDRVVALKILPSDIARDPAFSERFSREARALAKLNHPGIVSLFEFGRSGDLFFFLMEFVDGVTLRQLLMGERLSAREALTIVPRICDALQYAHDRGIVHRDIKPENILLDRQGNVKIADFGLVKLVDPESSRMSPPSGDVESGSRLRAEIPAYTEAGKLMGTPAYMAPEQIDHPSGVDHRADIYALGVIFYQMLTGELPDKPISPPSSRTVIDVRLDEVVIRALQQNPSLRFQQAGDLKTRVEEIAGSPGKSPPAARKPSLPQIAGVLLILCLPLSVALPVFDRAGKPEEYREEAFFNAPGQETREAEEVIKQALRPFPGISLSSQNGNTEFRSHDGTKFTNLWRISVSGPDQKQARETLDAARSAVKEALNRGNNDPLRETISWSEYRSSGAGTDSWALDQKFVTRLRRDVMSGIFLSALGLLCLSYRRKSHSAPASKTSAGISLGFLIIGAWGVFVLFNFFGDPGIQLMPAVALLAGIPAMISGLSEKAGRLGKFVAAVSWCGMLTLFLKSSLPDDRQWRFLDSAWTNVAIPTLQRPPAPTPPEKTRRHKRVDKTRAVEEWLEAIDAGKYDEAWARVSTLTSMLDSQSAWIEKMKAVRQPLGDVVGRKLHSTMETGEIKGFPPGRYHVFLFHSDFTGKSVAEEIVTLIYQEDGHWRVFSYSIQ
ncbi:protein kinase [Luteolibacter yonseiensis]|uniref:Protein kinase n=1 Tax=Luteolibacter yonseiensis TaxID=1144680 RepID=A0A934V607_9BACT|nr:protein kinase [Luteolibacter yonseiensis]MBK1814522.1 protein kinase [Luteolibacter yonseiensis]